MLSAETFNKINKLTRIIEQENKEEKTLTPEEANYLNFLATISGEYELVKVYEPDTKNYHFELRKN